MCMQIRPFRAERPFAEFDKLPAGKFRASELRAARERKSKGFTLIELLVVVAIISVLVSILVPSLRKAKDLAEQVVCATNQKNLGLAFHCYAMDHNDYLPTEDVGQLRIHEWFILYCPYISSSLLDPSLPQLHRANRALPNIGKAMPIFDCPTTKRVVAFYGPAAGEYFATRQQKTFDYFINMWHGKFKLTEVPSDQFLLADHAGGHPLSPNGLSSVGDVYCAVAAIDGGFTWITFIGYPDNWPYTPGWHHDQGVNMLFADGHVRWHDVYTYMPNFTLTANGWWVGQTYQVPP